MIEKVETLEFNRVKRVEKVERPIGLNLSTLTPTPESTTGRTDLNGRLTLSAITAPDPKATAWVAAVRSRFPNCKPLWGASSVGESGRDPNIGAVPWRDWWEGLV